MEIPQLLKVWAFACVSLALYGQLLGGGGGVGTTIDGIAFPGELSGQAFVGGGTRSKYGAVKVYAVGLYIDAARATSSLKPFVGVPAAKLPTGFFKTLQTGKFGKTLLLQFHRSVASETVAGAMRDSLASRLGAATLDKFREALLAALASSSVAKGDRIYFACRGDAMTISAGKLGGGQSVRDRTVCPAFLDVYVGAKPISPAAKAGIAAGFAGNLYKS